MSALVSGLLPSAFPALALAHFVALLSPGPDFFLVVGHAARRRLRGTVFLCAGIAAGNALYITLAVAGWSGLKHSPALYRCVELAGSAYLVWLGVMLFRSGSRPRKLAFREQEALRPLAQFVTGLGSAVLNPKNAVFYLTLMTVIIGPQATLLQQTAAGVWMTLIVFLWDAALAASLSLPKAQRFLEARIPLVERIAGAVLLVMGAGLALTPLL